MLPGDPHDNHDAASLARMQGSRILFIVHGARADRPETQELLAAASEHGIVAELVATEQAGDGARLAREGVAAGVAAVVALGGDGTVNDVLNGVAGTDVPLGIVPMGTANDFARQVGIPGDAREALEVILRHKPTRMDTASLNGHKFLNVSTGGVGAEITSETADGMKSVLGPLAYAITGVRKLTSLEPTSMCFEGPGFHLDRLCLLFAVGNARVTGGGTQLTPLASVTDGLIDVCVVEDMPIAELAPLLLKLRNGEHVGADGVAAGVHYARLAELTVRADRAVSVNVDGEPISEATLHYRAHQGDLSIYLPHLPDATTPSG